MSYYPDYEKTLDNYKKIEEEFNRKAEFINGVMDRQIALYDEALKKAGVNPND